MLCLTGAGEAFESVAVLHLTFRVPADDPVMINRGGISLRPSAAGEVRALFRKTFLARHVEGKENLVAAPLNFVDLRKSQSAEITFRGKQIISRLPLDKQSFCCRCSDRRSINPFGSPHVLHYPCRLLCNVYSFLGPYLGTLLPRHVGRLQPGAPGTAAACLPDVVVELPFVT